MMLFYEYIIIIITFHSVNGQLAISGKTTSAKVHPYLVRIGSYCGGVLIDPQWVITAGHCAQKHNIKLQLNDNNSYIAGDVYTHPKFHLGPEFNENHQQNPHVWAIYDAALIKLKTPAVLSDVVKPIIMSDYVTRAGSEGVIPSYSTQSDYIRYHPDIHYSEINEGKYIIQDKCDRIKDYNEKAMLCLEPNTTTNPFACNGDSGNGYIINGELHGIISWVEKDALHCIGCPCFMGGLHFATRLSAIREWIEMTTKTSQANNIHTNYHINDY